MGDVFKPWQRRVGVYTLLTACVFMAAWLRTFFHNDEATFTLNDRIHMVWTLQGGFIWLSHDAGGDMALRWDSHVAKPDSYGGVTRTEFAKSWREHFQRLGQPPRVWTANYATIIIPLALLSAYLLLINPRKSVQMKAPEPIPEKRATS